MNYIIRRNIIFTLVSFLIVMSVLPQALSQGWNATDGDDAKKIGELSAKYKALEVAREIETYLNIHPDKTIKDLQEDPEFQRIAVQVIGNKGYSAVMDANTAYIYFHPQKKLINTYAGLLKESLPDWWEILSSTVGETCTESGGYYDWKEEDGTISKKYMYLACVNVPTADGKKLAVAATTYLDELSAKNYLEKYGISDSFEYAKESIKQKAEDVARQIEIYIHNNPDKTIKDLQNDSYFQEIAVQQVGKTGYTAVTDYDTLICRFHKNPQIVNLDLETLSNKLLGFWKIMSSTRGGKPAEGLYDWIDADNTTRQKYMYIAIVNARTADDVGLSVAATTYLDEYNEQSTTEPPSQVEAGLMFQPDFLFFIIPSAGLLIYLFMFLSIETRGEEKKSSELKYLIILMLAAASVMSICDIVLSGIYSYSVALVAYRLMYFATLAFSLCFMLIILNISGVRISKEAEYLGAITCSLLLMLCLFTNLVIVDIVYTGRMWGMAHFTVLFRIIWLLILSTAVVGFLAAVKDNSENHNKISAGAGPMIPASLYLSIVLVITITGITGIKANWMLVTFPVLTVVFLGITLFRMGLLRQKRNTIMLVLAIALLLIVGLFVFNTSHTTMNMKENTIGFTGNTLTAVATSRARHIETWIREEKEYAENIALVEKIGDLLSSDEADAGYADKVNGVREGLWSYVEGEDETAQISIADSSGTIITSTDERMIGTDISKQDIFSKGEKSAYITGISASDEENDSHVVSVSAPVIRDGVFLGEVLLQLGTEEIFGITTERTGLEKTGEVYLVNEEGYMATPSRFNKDAVLKQKIVSENAMACLMEEASETQQSLAAVMNKDEYNNYRGVDVIGSRIAIPEMRMCLLAEIDKAEVTSKVSSIINKIWYFTIAMILSIVLIGIVFNFLLTGSLRKEVDVKTRELKKSNVSLNRKIKEANDAKKALINMMDDLSEANENLKELDRAKSNFLNIVSHELKTPLTAITAHLEVIDDLKSNLGRQELSSFDAIVRNSRQLRMLIENILEISRIESNKFELNLSDVDVGAIISGVVKNLGILAERKGIKLVARIKKLPMLRADEARLREILNNMVSNAIKFTEKGEVVVSASRKKDNVLIRVSDSGIGIPKDKIGKLFTKFYQVDETLSRRYGGTGLGLSITKQLVELQHGKIWVESTEGKGSDFIFTLPLKQKTKQKGKEVRR